LANLNDMREALHWWHNVLTDSGRSKFPTPESNDDIYSYYLSPMDYIELEYGMVSF